MTNETGWQSLSPFLKGISLAAASLAVTVLFALCGFGRFGAFIGAIVAVGAVLMLARSLRTSQKYHVPTKVRRASVAVMSLVPLGLLSIALFGFITSFVVVMCLVAVALGIVFLARRR